MEGERPPLAPPPLQCPFPSPPNPSPPTLLSPFLPSPPLPSPHPPKGRIRGGARVKRRGRECRGGKGQGVEGRGRPCCFYSGRYWPILHRHCLASICLSQLPGLTPLLMEQLEEPHLGPLPWRRPAESGPMGGHLRGRWDAGGGQKGGRKGACGQHPAESL